MDNGGDALRVLSSGWSNLERLLHSLILPAVPEDWRDTSHRGTGMNALLIVHGIGEQRRGETTEKLIVGLKAAYGGAVKVEHHPEGYPATVTANGHTVRLYEVHWADILSAQKSRGKFARLVHVVRTDDGDAGAGVGPLQGCETSMRACVSARGRH